MRKNERTKKATRLEVKTSTKQTNKYSIKKQKQRLFLGRVFDQDVFNMPKVQAGLETTYMKTIYLSRYNEAKVRWLHYKLGEWVEGNEGNEGNE